MSTPLHILTLLLLTLLNLPISVSSHTTDDGPQLTASLDYGTFLGAHSTEYNISYWQKIPFAAPAHTHPVRTTI